MDKEAAKQQFDYWTDKLQIEHTFSFDEAWEFIEYKKSQKNELSPAVSNYRNGVMEVQRKIEEIPQGMTREEIEEVNPLKHSFADGCYVREVFNPKGELIVTKIHKVEHPYFLLKGEMSILTEEGVKRLKAPCHGITPVGTKRIIYTHEDCLFVTVHVTRERDLNKIEDEIIAKDFTEIDELEMKKFLEELQAIESSGITPIIEVKTCLL